MSFKSNISQGNNAGRETVVVFSPSSGSHSIKDAVSKLLPPAPQSQKIAKAKAHRIESITPTPTAGNLSSMTTTTALLNKFLDT